MKLMTTTGGSMRSLTARALIRWGMPLVQGQVPLGGGINETSS